MNPPAGGSVQRNDTSRPALESERLEGCVLVVDDELPNREYLRRLLEKRGCKVVTAEGGAQALRMANDLVPDLILVDVMMPGMTGYEVTHCLKTEARTRDIPVIMVTARTEIEDIEAGFDAGTFDYIRKPFNPRELIARTRNALQLKRSNDALRQWKERMSRELKVAGSLQRKLLATAPLFTRDFEIRMTYRPSMAIGGDVFDVIKLPGGALCVYVGDVSGHGVGAAMVASLLKVIITEVVLGYGEQGVEVVHGKIAERFHRNVNNPEIYATLLLALYDPAARQWKCVNCGHPEPLAWQNAPETKVTTLSGGHMTPIGFDVGTPEAVEEMAIPATTGTSLLIYTDGLAEACRRDRDDACGVEGVISGLHRTLAAGSVALTDDLMTLLVQDGYHLEQDDCTAMTIECLDPATILLERSIPVTAGAVSTLAADCETRLLAAGWPGCAAAAVRLLVMEYGVNVVAHGRVQAGAHIELLLRACDGGCRLLFTDNGREWDMEGIMAWRRETGPEDEHGRGWEIIKAVARRREVFRRHHENIGFFEVAKDYTPE